MRRLLLIVIVVLVCSNWAGAWNGSMFFLTIPPSPIANGFGGVLLPFAVSDPYAPILNPAALGLQAQGQRLSAAIYPSRMVWAPNYDSWFGGRLRYSARTLNVGANQQMLGKWLGTPTHFSAGVGYNETFFDYPETQRRDENNVVIGTFHPRERMNGLTFGIGYENRMRAAFGFSFKYVDSDYGYFSNTPGRARATTFTHDLGGLVQYPLLNYKPGSVPVTESRFSPFLTPMVSYAITNLGGVANYTGDPNRNSPLPRTEHLTIAVTSGLTMHRATMPDWTLASLDLGIQAQDELIARRASGGFYYQHLFSDINVVRDLLLGKSNHRISRQRGYSISVLEIFSFGRGTFKDEGSGIRYNTQGFSLRLSGIMKLAAEQSPASWLNRFDIVYSESAFEQHTGQDHLIPVYDGIRYHQISLIIR